MHEDYPPFPNDLSQELKDVFLRFKFRAFSQRFNKNEIEQTKITSQLVES